MTYQPSTSQFLVAWFIGDLSGTVITLLVFGAFACVGADRSDVAMVLGAVASPIIFFKLWRRSAREQRSRGIFHCSTCGYQHHAEGEAGAI